MAVTIRIEGDFDPGAFRQAEASLKRLGGAAAAASATGGSSLVAMGTKAKALGDRMSSTGKSMTLGITAPLALVGAIGVKTAADFDSAMNQFGYSAGVAGSELTAFSDLAMQMGADTVFSAGEAASAMLELSKGGLEPAKIAGGALKSTMSLAAAGGLELADAATSITGAMNTFGISTENSAQIADALAGAANASAADVSDLTQALQQTGQQASASGQSLQETTAALAAFADAGLKGSDAGTSLKTFLQRIAAPTGKAAKSIKDLGMDFFDAQGKMKPLTAIAGQLQKGMSGLTQEQRLQAMQTIFGSDATRAANVLFNEGTAGLQEYVGATSEAGNAQGMADARMAGLSGSLESLSGSLETAAIALGQALAPTIQAVSEKIQTLADWFTNLDPGMQSTIVTVGLVVAAIGPLLMVTGKMISLFGSAVGTATTLASGVSKVAGAAKVGATGVKMFFSSASIADDALGGVKSAPGIFSRIGSAAKNAGSGIASGIGSGAKLAASGLSSAASGAATLATSLGQAAAAAARAGAAAVAAAAKTLAMKAVQMAVAAATALWTAAQWLLNIALNANPIGLIVIAIAALIAGIVLLWNNCETFRNVVMAVWGAIKTAIGAVVDWITGTAVPFLQQAWELIKTGLQAAWNAIQPIFETIKSVVMAVFGFIKAYFTTMFTIYKTIFTTAFNAIRTVVTTVTNVIRTIITTVWNAIKTYFTTMFNIYRTVFTTAWNAIKAVVQRVTSVIRSIITTVFNAVRTVITNVMNQAKAIVSGAVNAIKSAISKVSAIVGLVSGFFSRMVSTISNWIGKAVGIVGALPGKIVGALGNLGGLLVSKGVAIVQGLISGIQSMAGSVVNALLDLIPGPLKKFAGALGINSPAKKLIPYGAAITEGVAVGITREGALVDKAVVGLASRMTSAAGQLVSTFALPRGATDKAVKNLGGKRGAKRWQASWVNSQGKAMKKLFTTQEAAKQHLDKQQSFDGKIGDGILDAANTVMDRARDAAGVILAAHSEIRDSLVDFGSISTSPTNLGAGGIIRNLGARLAAIKKFGANMRQLTALGLNANSLKEIYGMGPVAGSQIAEALIKQGAGAVGEVNQLESQIRAESASVADVWTNSQYGRTGAEAQAVYDSSVNLANGAIQVTIAPGANATDAAAIRAEVETAFRAALPQVAAKVQTVAKGKKKKKKK
ncbi:MAG: phage tail tape measure protein [Candidatus Nanopelagicales bacterium]